MATMFAARVLANEDDCYGRSYSENREGVDGTIRAYRGKTNFSTDGFEDIVAFMGEAIPGLGPCSIYNTHVSKDTYSI